MLTLTFEARFPRLQPQRSTTELSQFPLPQGRMMTLTRGSAVLTMVTIFTVGSPYSPALSVELMATLASADG